MRVRGVRGPAGGAIPAGAFPASGPRDGGALALALSERGRAVVLPSPHERRPACRTGVVWGHAEPRDDRAGRCAYVSLASRVEPLLGSGRVLDLDAGPQTGPPARALAKDEGRRLLQARLLDGEVAAVVVPVEPPRSGREHAVSEAYAGARRQLRRRVQLCRTLLRQTALEEMADLRGASPASLAHLPRLWTPSVGLVLDVATELTRGADRQRYVDSRYQETFSVRIPALQERLARLGVRSNPLLVIG